MLNPWIFEANNFDFSQNVESVLYRNRLINKHLGKERRDKMLFLVGTKIIGKTFSLSYKSCLLRILNRAGKFRLLGKIRNYIWVKSPGLANKFCIGLIFGSSLCFSYS